MKKNMMIIGTLFFSITLITLLYLYFSLSQQLNTKSLELNQAIESNERLKKEIASLRESQEQVGHDIQPLFKMKILVTGGMDAEYVIDEINEEYVICRYFDFQHSVNPNEEQEKLTFYQIFNEKSLPEDPSSVNMFAIEYYLDYGDKILILKQSDYHDSEFERDIEYRKNIIKSIGKPVNDEILSKINWKYYLIESSKFMDLNREFV